MPAPYSGACLCEAVRFTVAGEPLTFYACHCTDCRRQTGSAYALAFFVQRSAVALEGDPAEYSISLPDGRARRGSYCAKCGTRLWATSVRRPDFVAIQAGVLRDPGLEPAAHLWTRSKLPFVALTAGARQYETQPEDPAELVGLWKDARMPG